MNKLRSVYAKHKQEGYHGRRSAFASLRFRFSSIFPRNGKNPSSHPWRAAGGERKAATSKKHPEEVAHSGVSGENRFGNQDAAAGNKIKSVKERLIWQKSLLLVQQIYQVTKSFPREEVYGLAAKMKRGAVSAPSNIAEGFRRRHSKGFKRFLNIGLGSLARLEAQVLISGELTYLAADVKNTLLE